MPSDLTTADEFDEFVSARAEIRRWVRARRAEVAGWEPRPPPPSFGRTVSSPGS